MEPRMAEGRPKYMRRIVVVRVGLGRDPWCGLELVRDRLRLDCRRVLMVSSGYRETSTVRPATAPA